MMRTRAVINTRDGWILILYCIYRIVCVFYSIAKLDSIPAVCVNHWLYAFRF